MLGLAEQIGRADFAVHAVVGDDQRLGRAGEQVDADAAVELALRLRHIGVARPDDHVDRPDRAGAERHRGDRLHAAEHVDLVRAAEMHRGDDRGMRSALERRRAGDDALHARDFRGDDRHVRRGDHRVAPARHVAADRVHRDVAVAEDHAGQRLDLEVLHRLALLLREAAHLRLRELDVVEVALGDVSDRLLDLLRRELERGRRPLVELLRQRAHRVVAALLDLRQDLLDRLAHLRVGGLDGARVHSAFEKAGHVTLLFPMSSRASEARAGSSPQTALHRAARGSPARRAAHSLSRLARLAGEGRQRSAHFIACGLIGLPVPPVMISGGPQKKNS